MATIDKYVIQMDVQGQQSVDRLKNSLGGLKSTIAGIGFATFIAQAFQAADAIGDVADATGIAVGQVGALADSLKLAGGDAKDVGKILTTFYGNLEQAASGSEKAQDALGKVGIKLSDLTKLSEGELLTNALASLAQMDAGAQRTAAGVDIFGKAFRNIDPTKLQQILDTKDVNKFQQEYVKAGQVVDNLEANFATLQKAVISALTPLIGETDNFRLSIEQAEKVVKTLGAVFATMFAVKTVGTIMDVVTVIRSLTTALKGTVIVQTALTALSGPRGWAIIAAGAAASAAAIYGLNKALEGTNDEMEKATGTTPGTPAPTNKPAFAQTSLYSKEELQARKQALTVSQQTTQQQIQQNKAAQDYQRIINSTIGMEQDQADIIKLNAQLEQDANTKILDLTKQIDIEKAKGRGTNQGIIVELQKQKQEVLDNLTATKQLKMEELARLQVIKDQRLENQLMFDYLSSAVDSSKRANDTFYAYQVAIGALTEEQANRKASIDNAQQESARKRYALEQQLAEAVIASDTRQQDLIRQKILLEKEGYNLIKKSMEDRYNAEDIKRQSSAAGTVAAMQQIARSMDPFTIAQNKVMSVFSNMNSAIDSFVENGKFSFKDFASSVIKDLIKIELKAQASKLLSGLFGGAGGGLFGGAIIPGFLAEGGPAQPNKPYIVGEKGPELFVPKSAGTVVPNGAGGGQTINNYITNNNVSAIDARSVAQFFAENRKTMLGTVELARKEMPYSNR